MVTRPRDEEKMSRVSSKPSGKSASEPSVCRKLHRNSNVSLVYTDVKYTGTTKSPRNRARALTQKQKSLHCRNFARRRPRA